MHIKECYATNETRKMLILKLPIYIDKNESNSLALLYNFGSVNGKINLSTIKVTTKLCRRKKHGDAVSRILLKKWKATDYLRILNNKWMFLNAIMK